MTGKIGRWGNSAAVRIPKDVLERAGLREGQAVDIIPRPGAVQIQPVSNTPRYTLEQLVEEMKRVAPGDRPVLEDWATLPSEWPDEDWSDIAPTDDDPQGNGP